MSPPSFIPDHVIVHTPGYRGTPGRYGLTLNGTPLGELVHLGCDQWGWDDAVMGHHWNWNLRGRAMGEWLEQRAHPRFPEALVRRLWPEWEQARKTHGPQTKPALAIAGRIADAIWNTCV